ncbi:MAG: DUF4167 domain-containing protein [Paracoccaceae bacterium]
MRSSKSRSRNKNNNRNRHSGNNMNRVFDSSGPEGKVRGTPQQIIEKYSQLARDATLGNDRVAAENFQQHSEHYTRMQAEAQREIDAKRETQEREHRERQQTRSEQPQQGHDSNRGEQNQSNQQPKQPAANVDPSQADQPDFVQPMVNTGDSGLVETPEAAPVKRRTRKPKTSPVATTGNAAQPAEPKAAE